ncbi:relaxase/mobilization nuclease [Lachnospiraceae bacterium JC7]|nr:relaxase/mobilization nuclease [Lachnospiraceae bacterium JC7]
MHQNKGKTVAQCLKARTDYAKNGEKTENEELISSYACDKETVDQEFLLAKQEYLRITGRKQKGDIIAYQIRQSFKPGEITPEEANAVGYETAMRFTKGNHAFIVATHTDKAHIHNHIIFNSTNLDCDRKFRDSWFIALVLQKVSDIVCLEHALSVIKPRKPSERDNRNPYHRASFRKSLREHIDLILKEDVKDLNEFLKRLQEAGYEIKYGKHISIRGNGQKRFIRLSSLGEGYTEEDIRKRIQREEEYESEEQEKPGKERLQSAKKPRPPARGFDLLIDINKKMQEGKGRGYERWAKVYNVKQVTKALLFLQEHGIRDYEELEKKAAETSERYDAVSNFIKEKEDKLHDIAALKMNIINFAKTKEIYDAYRASRYDKDFFEAHREEITLHRAAKEAFNRYKGKKLPKVKELSEQYREVLAEKRKLYGEYKEARKEMMDVKIAKQDIDRFLKIDEEQHQKENNKAQEHIR